MSATVLQESFKAGSKKGRGIRDSTKHGGEEMNHCDAKSSSFPGDGGKPHIEGSKGPGEVK